MSRSPMPLSHYRTDATPRSAPHTGRLACGRETLFSAALHGLGVLLLGRLVLAGLPVTAPSTAAVTVVFAPPRPPITVAPPALQHTETLQTKATPAQPAVVQPAVVQSAMAQSTVSPVLAQSASHTPASRIPASGTARARPVQIAHVPTRPMPPKASQPERPNLPVQQSASASAKAAQPAVSDGWLGPFTAQVQQAVQDAATYPPTARTMRMQGRVEVGFDYRDGAARDPRIVHTSRSGLLDRAALLAVSTARYPRLTGPAGLQSLPLVITVAFTLITDG